MKKNEKLLETLGEVNDELIPEEKDNEKKPKKSPIKWISAIGGVCVAAAIGIFAFNNLGLFNSQIGTEPDTTTSVTEINEPVTEASVSETDVTVPEPEEKKEVEIDYTRTRKSSVISEITANSLKGSNILTDTSFTIKSTSDLAVSDLKGRLSISPEVDFEIAKRADCEYILTANTAFEKGSVVKLSALSDEGGIGGAWAFQTVDDFRIKSVYPADGAEYVSVNSGIEFTFSEPVDISEVEAKLSIEPSVEGGFTLHNNTVYFIPKNNMKSNAYYKVTLSKGITSKSGNEMKEDYSFSFRTVADDERIYTYNGISETFIMGDPVVIEVQGKASAFNSEFDVKLYQYNNSDDYISDLIGYNSTNTMEPDEGKMREVFSSFEKPIARSNSWNPHIITLPYDLEEGYYVARIKNSNTTLYYFIEMNPISVYSASLGDNTAFFINDTNTGKSAAGAEIILHTDKGDFTAKADNNGVAQIATKDNANRNDVIEINCGGHRYIDLLVNYQEYKATYSDLYYTYLYTDRQAYQTTDTVNIWGVIMPRRDGVKLPERLYLNFGEGETGGKMVEIEPMADGTFTASISFEDRQSSNWASVRLLDGDNDNAVICSKSIRILDYVKPTYTFDITAPEYVVMPHKNPFDVTIEAKYFDGTPASDLNFDISAKIVSGSNTTDEKGIAAMELLFGDRDTWKPTSDYFRCTLSGIENTYQSAYEGIIGFYRDVMHETSYDTDKKAFTVRTNKMDFDKIPEYLGSVNGYDYDILRGEACDTKVTVSVEKNWCEKVSDGEYYDYIEKKTVKKYRYEHRSVNIGTYTVNTVNGTGIIENLDLTDESCWYYIDISYKDSLGQPVSITEYYRNISWYYSHNTNYRKFYLETVNSDGSVGEYDYYGYGTAGNTFREDEEVKFTLKDYHNYFEDDYEGRIFFLTYQNDVIDAVVYNSTTFTYKADKRCIPNFRYCGAYFDGRHVYTLNNDSLRFNPEEREIVLQASADKEKYDAGEEVTLTVFAKDKKGNPVKNAAVSLSVVDEAAFAVSEQYVNLLNNLYSSVWYEYAYQKCSYIQHVMELPAMGEKGGGEDNSSVRKDFRDNPYFGSVTTDENGKAIFTFKLADSITTWRATIQSIGEVNDRIYAGNIKTPIVATRPVFVTPIMLSEYTEGDDIAFTAKCVGLKDMDKISVTLSGSGEDKTIEILPCETADFGKLPEGEYKVTFRASNGVNSDAMELPLSVVKTKREVKISKDMSLNDIYSISPTRWPVSIVFYDKEYEFCKEILRKLSYYWGERLDMSLAAKFADFELGWSESNYSEAVESATANGYPRLMKNSEEDIKLAALLCGAFPESVSRGALINEFERTLKDCDAEDMAYCYMGLAALGKPVINDIKLILSENGNKLTVYDKLYLTAGLAFAGDFTSAYESYTALTKEMKFYEGRKGIYAYIINEKYTRLALLTASVLNLPEAECLARGLVSREPEYDSYALELVVYIRNYVPKISGDAQLSYTINGERKTVKLDRYGFYRLSFDREQFEKAGFKVDSGNVSVYASYTGRISEHNNAPTMTVTKTYSKTRGLKPGDLVTVNIKTDPCCVIEDIIPSCARLCNKNGQYYSSEGQKIRLCTDMNGRASYSIRITSSGDFVTEGAYCYTYAHDKDGDFYWGVSANGKITVDKVNESA